MVSYGISSLKTSISQHQLKLIIFLLSSQLCRLFEKIEHYFHGYSSAFCILTHLILTTTLGIIIPIFQMREVSQSALPKVTEPVGTEPKLD